MIAELTIMHELQCQKNCLELAVFYRSLNNDVPKKVGEELVLAFISIDIISKNLEPIHQNHQSSG